MFRTALFVFCLGFIVPLFAQKPPQIESVVFLIGDCGEPVITESPIGAVLRREVEKHGEAATVIYLGDNIYPAGLPPVGHRHRDRAEGILKTQADWVEGLPARGIFIPGNHDWQHWGRNGWSYILNQQKFIDSLGYDNVAVQPQDGCPGPVEIPLSDNAVLLIIDSQWFLHEHERPGEESDCEAKDEAGLMVLLSDALRRNQGRRVILAAHHPVISYGDHGGVFTLQDHLFPLVDLKPYLYIPMPVIGSIYPFYRSVLGHPQDIKHTHYKQFSKSIQELLKEYPGTIYAAGHEHALQHIVKDSVQYIVSGSGSKSAYVKKGRYAKYADGVKGIVKVTMYTDGSADLEFWQVDDDFREGKIVHTWKLVPVGNLRTADEAPPEKITGTVKVRASQQYQASKSKEFFFGSNYREAWATEIEAPVFYIGEQMGGLKIVQKGGGQQTLSLRLADPTGREWVLRSVEKNPEGAVPEQLRKTFAQDIVQDQISASHPYGALIIPPLAEAAGIYHTNPRLVYIPDDPDLGIYRKDFANTLAIFEERPDDDWSDKPSFGNSPKIVSTTKVIEKMQKDTDNQVDQKFTARSRLFDLWIGDWDRHDDQWRWASREDGKRTIYQPIPRDRDQAFFVNQGVIPKIWSRRWAMPKFEGFDDAIDWVPGFAFNARHFDRTFTPQLTEEDWIREAEYLQKALTDEVIEEAVKTWPREIYALDGPVIVESLKARRAELVKYARELHKYLSREVSVVGSNKRERFEITRKENGDLHVKGYNINKQGERGRKFYERDFSRDETREVQIYGLDGDDQFILEGKASKSILVRIIGGAGRDSVHDASRVSALRRQTLFYDDAGKNAMVSKGELKDKTSLNPEVNVYDRKAYNPNRLAPLLYGNFNPDDGLFVGGGFLYQTEGFRKDPFKARHIVLASVAPRTSSFNLLYRGDFTDVFGKWGVGIDADIKSPNYVNNFFGLGNESIYDDDIDDKPGINVDDEIDYYRFRFQEVRLDAYLTRKVMGSSMFRIGPSFQRVQVERPPADEDRYIADFAATLPYDIFGQANTYAGVSSEFIIDSRDDARLTTRGAMLSLSGTAMKGLEDHSGDFESYQAFLALYHPVISQRLFLAARVGGGQTFGDPAFYQSQILSGRTELRGFRKTRFYGDRKMFANVELRARLFSVRTYLFPASVGILGFHDLGRVWYKDEFGVDPSAGGKSNKWHKGWGGGLWFTPFNFAVVSVELGHSEEGNLGYVRLGFLF